MWLKQSTAATIALGPFVDDADGKTAETSLTISQSDIRLSKNGAAFAQTNNSAGATHMENGYYSVPLNTTDTNTLGRLRVAVSESGALPVWQDFLVLPANTYDSLVSGTDYLDVNSVTVSQSVAIALANIESDTITQIRGDSWAISLTIGAITGYSKLWFTIKPQYPVYYADSEATVQILDASSADGLLYINGAAAANSALGSIAVGNETTGAITINLDETMTALLEPGTYFWDVQSLVSNTITTHASGTFEILVDATRTTS